MGEAVYQVTPDGFDAAAVLATFWARLKEESPVDLELTYNEILAAVEMNDARKTRLQEMLDMMVDKEILCCYS